MTTSVSAASGTRTAPASPWAALLPPPVLDVVRGVERHVVAVVALVAVLARLPFLMNDPSRDEAGFLLVGQQWHAGGSSLYGDYWVDRPPLLVTIFRLAAGLGGLVPLRLIGCLATALVVVGVAHVARRLGGRLDDRSNGQRAAGWAALTAAALSVTPLLGGQSVNGELLAAPFVVAGLAAALAALDQPNDRHAATAAAAAGAAAAASLLVKQNMADVAVFACVAFVVARCRGEITTRRLALSFAAATAGTVTCLVVVSVWTVAHGTSLVGVYDAMYPFRVEAGRVMAASNRTPADARSWALVVSWVVSGGALLMGLTALALTSRRLRGTAVCGLVVVVLFDLVSIALGGSYWNHYLIQLVVPVAVLSGLLVAARTPAARMVVTATAVAAVIALGVIGAGHRTTAGTTVGQAIHDVAGRRDTIVTTWGHADVTRASGLRSPYPYLWSLPARTLDPRLTELSTLLAGPRAPTWFVTWRGTSTWGFHGGGPVAARALAEHYHPVAQVDDHTIYLHRGAERAVPELSPPSTDLSSSSARLGGQPTTKELP